MVGRDPGSSSFVTPPTEILSRESGAIRIEQALKPTKFEEGIRTTDGERNLPAKSVALKPKKLPTDVQNQLLILKKFAYLKSYTRITLERIQKGMEIIDVHRQGTLV